MSSPVPFPLRSMNHQKYPTVTKEFQSIPKGKALLFTRTPHSLLQRKCACGGSGGASGECEECREKRSGLVQRRAYGAEQEEVPPVVYDVLRSPGQALDAQTRSFMEPKFGHDFSKVRVHSDDRASQSARAVNAFAYSVGEQIVFGEGQYAPASREGTRLLAHELTHVVQQAGSFSAGGSLRYGEQSSPEEHEAERNSDIVANGSPTDAISPAPYSIAQRAAPYIKKITVHLTPPQSAELEWEGTPPSGATGSDSFTVSTGKGYSDPGDPAGTCTRSCCSDALTQCAPPWNQPGRVGACCTYYGDSFWTGRPVDEHNGWKWWTPVQPYYSSRGIALHQHTEVTGQPIGHGCVRMDEPNAKRIYDFSNGTRTNVTMDGRAAPVLCDASRQCGGGSGSAGAQVETGESDTPLAVAEEPVAGLEGEMT